MVGRTKNKCSYCSKVSLPNANFIPCDGFLNMNSTLENIKDGRDYKKFPMVFLDYILVAIQKPKNIWTI